MTSEQETNSRASKATRHTIAKPRGTNEGQKEEMASEKPEKVFCLVLGPQIFLSIVTKSSMSIVKQLAATLVGSNTRWKYGVSCSSLTKNFKTKAYMASNQDGDSSKRGLCVAGQVAHLRSQPCLSSSAGILLAVRLDAGSWEPVVTRTG